MEKCNVYSGTISRMVKTKLSRKFRGERPCQMAVLLPLLTETLNLIKQFGVSEDRLCKHHIYLRISISLSFFFSLSLSLSLSCIFSSLSFSLFSSLSFLYYCPLPLSYFNFLFLSPFSSLFSFFFFLFFSFFSFISFSYYLKRKRRERERGGVEI